MRYLISFLIFFTSFLNGFCQHYDFGDTVYYDVNYRRVLQKHEAYHYRTPAEQINDRYQAVYYIARTNKPVLKGFFLPAETAYGLSLDYADAIKDGYFTLYDSLGNIAGAGEYQNNKQTGLWKFFRNKTLIKSVICTDTLRHVTDYSMNGWKTTEGWMEHIPGSKYNVRYVGVCTTYFSEGNLAKAIIEYKNGRMNGVFHRYDSLGNLYLSGTNVDGKSHGQWIGYYPYTNIINAKMNYDQGVLNGEAFFYDSSGIVFKSGNYRKDVKHGEWLHYFPNGALMHRLSWTNNKLNGQATYYDSLKNTVASGSFKDNKKDGKWTYFWKGNNRIKEELYYADDILHGIYRQFDSTTTRVIVEGKYQSGNPRGVWNRFSSNGNLMIQTTYKKSVGKVVHYDEDMGRLLMTGKVKKGLQEGQWTRYYPGSKKIEWEKFYSNGLLDGTVRWLDTMGYITTRQEYRNGLRDGVSKLYYEYSDKLWLEVSHKNDRLDGPVKTYYRNGKQKRQAYFKEGVKESDECYDLTGQVVECSPLHVAAKSLEDINTYIGANIIYPADARAANLQGKVDIGFFINEYGKVVDVELRKGFAKNCNEEALRLIRQMPDWQPEFIDGRPVVSYHKVPVVFWLPDEHEDGAVFLIPE